MARFVEFSVNGDRMWINPDNVAYVKPLAENRCAVVFTSGGDGSRGRVTMAMDAEKVASFLHTPSRD